MNRSQPNARYSKQDRGNQAAYAAYFAGMDASMQQKVALTTAHFPTRGRIADMGSGSGRGTYDLACLYQGLELIGVDINPVAVARAAEQYRRDNLSYVVGDIAARVFPAESLDGILDSSVLHHVTSFNDFAVGRVFETLDNQVAQLRQGGVIIIRDFVIPDGPEQVLLDLPTGDGAPEGEIPALSTSALFERFAAGFRSSVNRDKPVPFKRKASPRAGYARYELALRAAAEFVLRKDYRADWATELIEEYTYLNQAQFEAAFRQRGLRIVASMPIWNPWIVANRFAGKFYLSALDETPLPFPPTNYLIVGQKVDPRAGVTLLERERRDLRAPRFLMLKSYRQRDTGQIYELVERPQQTVDLLPWFESEGQLFVLAKKDFPRPIVNACAAEPRLDGASFSGYITEPISAIIDETEEIDAAARRILSERAGLAPDDVVALSAPFFYFTSPGGLDERVMARLVEVRPRQSVPFATPNYTRLRDAGTVRALDAAQVLRACHVGGMFDARLELNIYALLRALSRSAGPWIGAPVNLTPQETPARSLPTEAQVLAPEPRAAFASEETATVGEFLALSEGSFVELNSEAYTLAAASFEYVAPRGLSRHTVAALPVIKTAAGAIFAGIERRDLPAAQRFAGNSRLAAAPAWRLPRAVKHQSELPSFLTGALARDFSVTLRRAWELGGPYFPTPGVTPEVIYPYLVEVTAEEALNSSLSFIALDELLAQSHLIQDAHLLLVACRAAHALGLLTR